MEEYVKSGGEDKVTNHYITFDNVSLSYNNNEEYSLQNISFDVDRGEIVGIIGGTGSGKTSIINLLCGFYEATKGNIYIDNQNIQNLSDQDLDREISLVMQKAVMFRGTIEENIKYGKTDATFEEVVEAAKNANIHDFIMTLPNGYQTITGERGVKLSGGQKQRISIARLFLKNPPIIILDEATSSLDNITEKLIQEAFDRLLANKTSIIIAHRLSTIKNSDRIIVLGKEGIIEEGKHDELIKKEGYYNKLYNASVQI